MSLQKYAVPFTGKMSRLLAPVGSRLSYPMVRMFLMGIVPEGYREISAWFDPKDEAQCFLIGANLTASVVRAYEVGENDMWFNEDYVVYPIRLWLKK